jgi:polysaccharide export outer membrane protein
LAVSCLFIFTVAGCQPFDFYGKSLQPPVANDLQPPREMSMVSLPAYRIAPPDVLQLEVLKLVPRPPYRIEVYDVLMIRVAGTPYTAPIYNYYLVDEEGKVDFGPVYGKLSVAGLTIEEATAVATQYLQQILRQPDVSIQLARTGGTQEITGIYLVQQDGNVNLRQYGVVHVAGKTTIEAREAIEKQLSQYFDSPQVAVNVSGYNSKMYYVIREGSVTGEDIVNIPITGKETVLDAIANIGGLSRVSGKLVWISRPAPGVPGCEQILPIDYLAITRGGSSATNYQLLPGDRVFIAEDGLVTTNGFVQKVVNPIYRLFSVAQLGSYSVKGMQFLGPATNARRVF